MMRDGLTALSRTTKKLRPGFGGSLAAREPVWDGEGWGCDRVACPLRSPCSAVAGAGGRGRRASIAERDPAGGIALRLALDEAVAGLVQGQDVFVLVVENELALVGLHRQHRMSLALLVAHDGDEEGLAWPSGIDQHLALQQHVVFAVTVTVRRQRPLLDHAPMIHVGHRLDGLVDPFVDAHEIAPRRLRHHDVAWLCRAAAAFAGVLGAEFDPADRRTRDVAEARIDGVAGFRLNAHPQEDGKYSQPFPLSLEQHCGPRFSCWDHISHKGFAPPLSRPSRFDTNASKRRGEFKLYLNRIRLKFETSAIDSNFMH